MRVLVIANPAAGGRQKDVILNKIRNDFSRYGIAYDIYETKGSRDDEKIKKIIREMDPHALLVIGGDGTINLAARSVIHSTINLGIIPFGSANGMATDLGIKADSSQALDDFLKSRFISTTDILRINDKFYCLHIGDVGLNAMVVEDYQRDKDRGMRGYARHFIRQLSQSELMNVRIHADGKNYNEKGYMVAFANARRYGTGVILNRKGNPFDGKFEIIISKSIELKTFILAGLSRYNDDFAKDSSASSVISCKNAVITFDKPFTTQADGEILGKYDALKIEIIPQAVRIIRANPEING